MDLDMTLACELGRHDTCKGNVLHVSRTAPCQCPHHGPGPVTWDAMLGPIEESDLMKERNQ